MREGDQMRGMIGSLMAGVLMFGASTSANGQVTFSLGNPYRGGGPSITIGQPASTYYGSQPGYAQPGYVQPGYAAPGYASPGYFQPGYGASYGQTYVNRSYVTQPATPYPYPSGATTNYYNSGYRGYTSSGSPYYDRGYYNSTYVNPSQPYLAPTSRYPAANPYYQGAPSTYYLPR